MPTEPPFGPQTESKPKPEPTINSINFNQDGTRISAATTTGITLLTTEPYTEFNIKTFTSGVSAAHMLFRSNFFALIGGQFSPKKLMIYDGNKSDFLAELSFRTNVVSARLRRDRIVVVLASEILVYNFINLKLLDLIETSENSRGLCEVSSGSNSAVLVCPGLLVGQVRVENYGSSRRSRLINAHGSEIGGFGLSIDGRYVATASIKGTLIRVFNTLDGTLLQEVRRGTEKAEIQSLAFSFDAQWLAASSDKGTVHVFRLKQDSVNNGLQSLHDHINSPRSRVSSISFMKGVLPKYFSSEWSLAQFHLKEGVRHIVAFGREESILMIVGMDGSYYRCEFDPVSGGEMKQLGYHNFLEPEKPVES